jgi:hypothetical protein
VKARVFIAALVLLLVGLGVLWFRENFEKRQVQEWVGASGEARLRPYLAAERFAQRMGWKATEVRSLPELGNLPASGVLLLPPRRQALTSDRLAEIIAWVERGGHLIADAEYLGVSDPLFDALRVGRAEGNRAVKPRSVELRPGRSITASLYGGMKVVPPAAKVRFRIDEQLVSFVRGRGLVTVTTTLDFAENGAIGQHDAAIGQLDHAELLWHILTLTPSRELVVYWAPARLSLWSFLTENAAPALIGFLVLLALWLWSIAPRFGPVAPDAPPGRRRLLDHLRASGRYFWNKGLRARLVIAARDAALRRISRVQPDFAGASERERVTRVASLTGNNKEEAHRFLVAGGAMRGADFIKLTQQAQRIHSALEKGAK